jgi:fructokinase
MAAVEGAQARGLLISYDPNLRLNLWPSAEVARQGMLKGWGFAQVAKVSGEELTFLSGQSGFDASVEQLWHDRLRLLVITEGQDGCQYVTRDARGRVPGYSVRTIDTTGAGDGFVAGLLAGLLANEHAWESVSELENVLHFANAVGALTTTRRGAIPALPTKDQVLELLKRSV